MAKNRRPTVPTPEQGSSDPAPEPLPDAEGFAREAAAGALGVPAAPKAPAPAPAPVPNRDAAIAARDAEITRLREELAQMRAAPAPLPGGKFTVGWKDGPTLTIEVKAGESPADALSRYGVHSVPHKLDVHKAPEDAVLGQHLPSGQVRPFVSPASPTS